jgi:hypothetical protein
MDGWDSGVPVTAEMWSNDIRHVTFAGVRLIPIGTAAQKFDICSFILVGSDFASAPALLVSLGDAYRARFGIRDFASLTAAQRVVDADGDGITDVGEILTGTNPDDPNSVFAAQVVAVTAEGVTIKWPSVEGAVYTVARTPDLVGGSFSALVQGYRLTAKSTGFMEFTDTTAKLGSGPYFYRVVKE